MQPRLRPTLPPVPSPLHAATRRPGPGAPCAPPSARRLVALVAGFIVLGISAGLQAKDRVEQVDVIVQADGACDTVGKWIESAGGKVRFRYRNVPALAVTLPAHQVAALGGVAGVTVVEKDRWMYLNQPGIDAGDRAQAFVVAARAGHHVQSLDPAVFRAGRGRYGPLLYSGAPDIWNRTSSGAGSIVAVVDSGVARNSALAAAVIGAPGFPNGYNAFPDEFEATDPGNYWHGTFVAGVIAGSSELHLDDPADPLYRAVAAHLPQWAPAEPGAPLVIPLLGQAPLAQIYPVKVFPHAGGGTPNSIILEGLDHLLTLKKTGALDIDIVNLSLGGPTVWDGLNTFDRFLTELTHAQMLVVVAASNEGPIPNSVGSPATAYAALSVGALDYAPSSRVLYEWLGLSSLGQAGMGLTMRPTTETRVANFSSRGPLSDGRVGPEITALGNWNLGVGPDDSLMWATGTSFAAPAVAGVAALLNAYWENQGNETAPNVLQTSLLRSADPTVVGKPWRDVNRQGYGAVDAVAALDALRYRRWSWTPDKLYGRPLAANILGDPVRGRTQSWASPTIDLRPGETYDAVWEVGRSTSRITVEVYDIQAPDNYATAYWPNSLEVHLQSAKRTAAEHPIATYWYPFLHGNSFTIDIQDGPWVFAGQDWGYRPMEPGLMKLTFAGDASNESSVQFRVRVRRENQLPPLGDPIAQGTVRSGDSATVPVTIPPGTTRATFDLRWNRDWSALPTSDMDMYLLAADGRIVSLQGATPNAPERAVLEAPEPGNYFVFINAFEVYRRDDYRLYLKLE